MGIRAVFFDVLDDEPQLITGEEIQYKDHVH